MLFAKRPLTSFSPQLGFCNLRSLLRLIVACFVLRAKDWNKAAERMKEGEKTPELKDRLVVSYECYEASFSCLEIRQSTRELAEL